MDGKDHYLGKHGSRESKAEYRRLIAEWQDDVRRRPDLSAEALSFPLTVTEIAIAYWRHVETYYVKNGQPTSKQSNIRQALRFVRQLYGPTQAKDFGPLALKKVREAMIEAGRCRKLINKDIHRVRGMFRWAAAEELYPGPRLEALRAVSALEKDRSNAKERPPVAEVADEIVLATIPQLSPEVGDMVRLQMLTAARPGEVCAIRPRDIDRTDHVCWHYRPESHKTEHFGRERLVLIGPRAQEVLRPWLDRDPETYCFCPAEVVAKRSKTGQTSPARRTGKRPAARPKPGGRYTKDSYRVAIKRACKRAGVPPWTPYQLRHTRATAIRRDYDIEAAQIVLGHAKPDTTLIYAERDLSRAREVMGEIG